MSGILLIVIAQSTRPAIHSSDSYVFKIKVDTIVATMSADAEAVCCNSVYTTWGAYVVDTIFATIRADADAEADGYQYLDRLELTSTSYPWDNQTTRQTLVELVWAILSSC
jgi:hypothetical protein